MFVHDCFALTNHVIEDVGGILVIAELLLQLGHLGLHLIELGQLLLNFLLLALILLLFFEQLLMCPPTLRTYLA